MPEMCIFMDFFFFLLEPKNPKVVLPTVVISVLICTCDFRVVCLGTSGLFLTLEGNQFFGSRWIEMPGGGVVGDFSS